MSACSLAALVLAAGESSRMGVDKALLQYQGRSFLEGIVNSIRHAGIDNVAVVLGHHAAKIREAVPLQGIQVVVNRDYRLGQTSSLQAGLKALGLSTIESLLLCLVDHPAVSPEVIRELLRAHRNSGASLVIPTYGGRRGHPVLIGHPLFAALLELEPSEGANSVMRKHRNSTREVPVEDPSVLIDVDLPEDYRRLVEGSRR